MLQQLSALAESSSLALNEVVRKALCWVLLVLLFGIATSASVAAQTTNEAANTKDWPSFLGPNRDSKSTAKGVAAWPAAGPKILWQKEVGEGYGIGSIVGGQLFQFARHGDQERLTCMDAATGKAVWKFEYPTQYVDLYDYNGGPRCSPVIDGLRVYVYGAEGMLHCLSRRDGKVRWKVDVNATFGVIQNFFGVGSTPVIEGDLLIVMVGGSPDADKQLPPGQLDRVSGNGSGIVAFDKLTGKVRYKITDELASYSSPIVATIKGRRWGFAFCRGGLVGFEPASGKVDFEFPWRARILESVNAATPIVVDDQIFISETYGPGSALLKVKPGGYDVVWQDEARARQRALQAHWNTPIHHRGHVYGCSGRHTNGSDLRCLEWSTGKVKWRAPLNERSSLLYVDDHFICLTEYGTLFMFKANPEQFELVSQVNMKDEEGRPLLAYPCWSAPVLADGRLFVLGKGRLVCLELPMKSAGERNSSSE